MKKCNYSLKEVAQKAKSEILTHIRISLQCNGIVAESCWGLIKSMLI